MNLYEFARELQDVAAWTSNGEEPLKIAIDDIVTTYSGNLASHKAAWANLLKNKLANMGINADVLTKHSNIHEYDIWLVALPMEFVDKWNLFSGADDETAARIQRLLDFKGYTYILDSEMPDVGKFVESRLGSCSDGWAALDRDKLSQKSSNIRSVNSYLNSDIFVLGDSHSVSVYEPGADISRNDGKTLFGALKQGFLSMIPPDVTKLITYFGNIDVRHHLCRQANPKDATIKLVERYIEELKSLQQYGIKDISVVKLLPIEHEGRKIPKTGWYQKAPFYGSQKERSEIQRLFNHYLSKYSKEAGFNVIEWPESWYEIDPEEFATLYMEKPGSVHLSRKFYQWDFETNQPNKLLISRALF